MFLVAFISFYFFTAGVQIHWNKIKYKNKCSLQHSCTVGSLSTNHSILTVQYIQLVSDYIGLTVLHLLISYDYACIDIPFHHTTQCYVGSVWLPWSWLVGQQVGTVRWCIHTRDLHRWKFWSKDRPCGYEAQPVCSKSFQARPVLGSEMYCMGLGWGMSLWATFTRLQNVMYSEWSKRWFICNCTPWGRKSRQPKIQQN